MSSLTCCDTSLAKAALRTCEIVFVTSPVFIVLFFFTMQAACSQPGLTRDANEALLGVSFKRLTVSTRQLHGVLLLKDGNLILSTFHYVPTSFNWY